MVYRLVGPGLRRDISFLGSGSVRDGARASWRLDRHGISDSWTGLNREGASDALRLGVGRHYIELMRTPSIRDETSDHLPERGLRLRVNDHAFARVLGRQEVYFTSRMLKRHYQVNVPGLCLGEHGQRHSRAGTSGRKPREGQHTIMYTTSKIAEAPGTAV